MSLLDKINEVPEPEPSSAWLWIVGGLLVIGVIVVVVVCHTNNTPIPEQSTDSQQIPIETEYPFPTTGNQ